MKIIKPLRLSVLNRPFRLQGQNHLGVSVMALADMSATPQLRPEVELWQLAASELQTSGGVLDMAMPKARASFSPPVTPTRIISRIKPPARYALKWMISARRWRSLATVTGRVHARQRHSRLNRCALTGVVLTAAKVLMKTPRHWRDSGKPQRHAISPVAEYRSAATPYCFAPRKTGTGELWSAGPAVATSFPPHGQKLRRALATA